MPFVVDLKKTLEKSDNVTSCDGHLSFDEYQVLQSNQDYLRRAINVEQVEIRVVDSNDTNAATSSNLEDLEPGKPLVHFRYEASVTNASE